LMEQLRLNKHYQMKYFTIKWNISEELILISTNRFNVESLYCTPPKLFSLHLGAVKGNVQVNEFLAADIGVNLLGKEIFVRNVSL
jgi:hypothetical protein